MGVVSEPHPTDYKEDYIMVRDRTERLERLAANGYYIRKTQPINRIDVSRFYVERADGVLAPRYFDRYGDAINYAEQLLGIHGNLID